MNVMKLLQLASIPRTFGLAYVIRQAEQAHSAGHMLSFDYIPKPITNHEELVSQLAYVEPQMHQLSRLFPQSHWSIKPDMWGLSQSFELYAEYVSSVYEMCQQSSLQLRIDTPQNNQQMQCLSLALQYADIQPVLAVNSVDFTQAFEMCMQYNRIPRLVKGTNSEPTNKYTESECIISLAQRIWEAGHTVAIATHDVKLLDALTQLPDFGSHRLEVEMVAQLKPSSLPDSISAPMLRLYFPFGPGCSRFFARRLHQSHNNRQSVINAISDSLSRH